LHGTFDEEIKLVQNNALNKKNI